MISHLIKTRIYILGFFLIAFSCSNNSNETVIFHFSKEEMKELNKTGKVVQTDNKKVKLELASLGMSITLKKQVA